MFVIGNMLVGDGMAFFYSGILALEMAAWQGFGGAGFEIGRIEIGNRRGEFGFAVALVGPILVPGLVADKAGRFVADLAIVEVEVSA